MIYVRKGPDGRLYHSTVIRWGNGYTHAQHICVDRK